MSEEADKTAPVVEDAGRTEPAPVEDKPKSKPVAKGKKAAAPEEEIKFEYGDIVLARLRGFPAWPARITDPDELPANVLAQRPKNSTFYCTQFFPAGDYSWLPPKMVAALKPHQIDAFLKEPHRKASGQLREAYETARDPTEWDAFQADARRAAEEAQANEDIDELEDEEEMADKGKRKRAAPAPKKPAKKPKTAQPKADDKPKTKADKPKTKAKEDKEEGDPMSHNREAAQIKDWRHKLQRAFVGHAPTPEDMAEHDKLFKSIEEYTDMRAEFLNFSKIEKVLKLIVKSDTIPRDDEFHIRARADKLLDQWQPLQSKYKKENKDSAKANGAGKEDGAEASVEAPAEDKVEDAE